MNKETLIFDDIVIDDWNSIWTDDVDIDKMLISKKVSFGKKGYKYFIDYKHNLKVIPLHLTLPEIDQTCKKTRWSWILVFII